MCRTKLIPFYLVASAVNGILSLIIALLLSISTIYSLAIWGLASAATFVLICLVCIRSTMNQAEPTQEVDRGGSELENAGAYR